ncbi:hypothetical protein TNIN_251771 [Trichonephila inaurata madagascariensis]|uniref:Uncharacterized protein n=1 Tax=Trichonephila inaurata madagascariensis TaxID=2747483 RepID=A0A8X6YRA3_9ARAC|nr:hypothetical protein TNIN_251771 [Trichonephila inaurata madagascariensis]
MSLEVKVRLVHFWRVPGLTENWVWSVFEASLVGRKSTSRTLGGLIANNPQYKDVTIGQNVVINEEDIIRVEEAAAEMAEETNGEPTQDT